jgi:hypothetical protein
MRITRIGPVAAGAVLLTLAGLHAAWGAGASWPFADRAALADAVIGVDDVPGPAACFTVSAALAMGSLLVAGRPAPDQRIRRGGAGVVAAVLAGRGVLGLAVRTQAVSPASDSARFRRLDRLVYSPLCLVLAALSAPSALPGGRSGGRVPGVISADS